VGAWGYATVCERKGHIAAENTYLYGVPHASRGGGSRRVRRCRYWRCKRPFWPRKPNFHYCTWDCRVADVGADYARDYRGHQVRLADIDILPGIWKALVVLVHPDRWQGTPALLPIAHEAMVWLLEHRPSQN